MSVKWIDRVFEHSQAAGTPLLVLICLADWADDAGECWPSISAIAKKCRLKDERHVKRVIRDLERLGEVVVIIGGGQASRKGGLRSNRYRLTVHLPDESQIVAEGPPSAETDSGSQTPQIVAEGPPQIVAEGPPEPSCRSVIEPSRANGPFDDEFERVWSAYPRKLDRGRARSAYIARRRAKVSAEDLLAATRNYATAMRGTEPRFVKHAATFFGADEPFRDFVDGIPAGAGSSEQSKSMAAVDRVLASVTPTGRRELST